MFAQNGGLFVCVFQARSDSRLAHARPLRYLPVALRPASKPPLVPDQTQSQQSSARQSVNAAVAAAPTLTDIRTPGADPSGGAGQDSATVPGGLYVAQVQAHSVNEYALPDNKNGPPKCKDILPAYGVYGIGVNARHVLYVPLVGTFGQPHKILTFGPNCGKAGPTLDDPNGSPIDVAFDNTNDTVYVADIDTRGIDVYEKGATSPTRTLHNDQLVSSPGVAVDSHGNVFQSGHDSANIVEYFGGKQQGNKILPLTGGGTACSDVVERSRRSYRLAAVPCTDVGGDRLKRWVCGDSATPLR